MKKLIFTGNLFLIAFFLSAQKATDCIKNFPSFVKWYKITDAGILVVGTNDALYVNGQKLWINQSFLKKLGADGF